jgi:hypothetical protein
VFNLLALATSELSQAGVPVSVIDLR